MSKESAKNEGRKSALAGAASAVLASKSSKNILGYEKVHHGTQTLSAAQSIREKGILKRHSGSGIAKDDIALGHLSPKEAKGKVYTSTSKHLADAHRPKMGAMHMGDRVTARMPYRAKHRLGEDTVFANAAKGKIGDPSDVAPAKRALKTLRIYKHDVKPRFIVGGAHDGGRRQFATKGNMRRYLSQAGGKARFAKGVAQAAGAVGGGMYAVAKAIQARKEAKK